MTAKEHTILRQVQADIPRTKSHVLSIENGRLQLHLERLLYVWAIRHSASGYVQGMNDLALVFFTVLLENHLYENHAGFCFDDISDELLQEVEADTYWCLDGMISKIHDHYIPDQPGIQRMNFRLKELIKRYDSSLFQHLEEQDIEISHFSSSWMNCLFVRELPLNCLLRTWDTYLSENLGGFDDFHVYVCAAFLCHFSSEMKTMEYESLCLFLCNMPTKNLMGNEVELFLSQAYVLKCMYSEAVDRLTVPLSHLRRRSCDLVAPLL